MSQFSGRQDFSGPLAGRRNKGVMAIRRETKRQDAEARNAETAPERRRAARRERELALVRAAFGGGLDSAGVGDRPARRRTRGAVEADSYSGRHRTPEGDATGGSRG